jgi:ATP-dependent DNA ligase
MKLMLAGKAPNPLWLLRFPVYVSPKLDGIRAFVEKGVVMSRNNKPIPNIHVQRMFGKRIFNGIDGELIVGRPTDKDCYRKTMSVVMSDAQTHDEITFCAFDMIPQLPDAATRFEDRLRYVERLLRNRFDAGFRVVAHLKIYVREHLTRCELAALEDGYEGLMIRDPHGYYKHGRSTTNEGGLLKLKRFEDGEAIIIGFNEEMHNANEKVDGKRTSHKAGKSGKGTLGSFQVRETETGATFGVSGITAGDKLKFWEQRASLLGLKIKYKYFPSGNKDAPRFPTFLGFRSDV